jgi:threonylcarbamoyladenosine tRNA methylthiotransferase MtaB
MTSVLIHNFGCRVNQAEAFGWAEELQSRGLRLEKDIARSDLVVVNTCTLTNRAESDVRRYLRRVTRLNPSARLVLTGCSVALDRARFEGGPQVWLVVPNEDKAHLADRVLALVGAAPARPIEPFRSRALIKIQDGCDFRCAFCIIPAVRGGGRSLAAAEILSKVRGFAERGFAEVVLSGVQLGSYGTDLVPRTSLLELLETLEKEAGGIRLRLSSLDPRFMTAGLLDFFAASRAVCPHFHLSLQSGSDTVLERMGRRIGATRYCEILTRLAECVPGAALGADIIVGFPGETEEEFDRTRRFVEASPLTYLHVFSYSPRAGTPAAVLPQLDAKVKKRRSASLRALAKDKNLAFRRTFVGRESEAVVIKRGGALGEVLTPNYIKVLVAGGLPQAGACVRVRISRATPAVTEGRVCPP